MADAGHREVGLELSTEAGEREGHVSAGTDGMVGQPHYSIAALPKNTHNLVAKTNLQLYFCNEYHGVPRASISGF